MIQISLSFIVVTICSYCSSETMDAAYKKFHRAVFIWDRNLLRAGGHDLFDVEFKPHLGTYAIYLMVASFATFILYTLLYYDSFTKMNCLFFLALIVQVCVGFNLWDDNENLTFFLRFTGGV